MKQDDWRKLVAQIVRRKLERIRAGLPAEESLIAEIASVVPDLWDPSNIEDQGLNAVLNFADSFFDAQWHGFPDMDGIPWDDAYKLLTEAIECIERGESIRDPRVLRYYYPKRDGILMRIFRWFKKHLYEDRKRERR